jgi:aarF domain-containing kinase
MVAYLIGLSCVDLMMADFEALTVYINYFWQSSKVLLTTVPETYGPQIAADYFLCRPHVLGFRIIEVSLQQNCVQYFLFSFSLLVSST